MKSDQLVRVVLLPFDLVKNSFTESSENRYYANFEDHDGDNYSSNEDNTDNTDG